MRFIRSVTTFVLAVVASTLITRPSEAQHAFRAGIGADIPVGRTADVLTSGFHTTLGFAFTPHVLRHEVRLDASFAELSTHDSASTTHRIQSYTADIVLAGPSRLTPAGYVVLGVGTYQQSGRRGRKHGNGINVGAGINFPRHVAGAFLEARLHYIDGRTRTKYFPVTFGLVF